MALEIVPVRGRRALGRFIGLPWKLIDRRAYPRWIPPLRASVADDLDAKGNPFYRKAERELFVALRDGRPVGRIAAIHNRRHNEHHHDRVGFFGFFECADDPAAAAALLDAAAGWLRARGLDTLRGPTSPSINHECGLLVDGFDTTSTFLTAWNPPYYASLLEGAGLTKAKDLLGFWIPRGFALSEAWRRGLERARERAGFTFRLLDRKRFDRDADAVWEVYNAAWEKNWGFVPMSHEEFLHTAGFLKLLLVDEFVHFAEAGGETVGITVSIPDYNRTLARVPGGRLLFALPLLLWDRTRLRRGRTLMMGVKARYRSHSVAFVLFEESIRRAHAYGMEGIEASWILEDNKPMIAFLEQGGLKAYKRWRIYDREIG